MVGFMKSVQNLFGINKKSQDEVAGGLDEFLTGLPERLGYKISFRKTEKSDVGLHFEVEGEEADSFIGNSSEILDALSHLSMRVQRKTEGLANEPVSEDSKDNFRIVFDAAGFREKKTQELKEMAAQKRDRVMESGGKPAYVPALSPSDRKVIHTHLAELGDVVSESIGKGNFKRIRIRLKDESKRTYVPQANESEGSAEGSSGNERRSAGGRSNNGQGGGGGGRGRGGRGRGGRGRGNGQGNGQGRGPRANNNRAEVDGNRAPTKNDYVADEIDDNIGNRLAPGETPLYPYGQDQQSGQNSD